MKFKLLCAGALGLVMAYGCAKSDPYEILNKDGFSTFTEDELGFFGEKTENVDPKCFYQKKKATFPTEQQIRQHRNYALIPFMISDNGVPRQMVINSGSTTETEILKLLEYDDQNFLLQRDKSENSETVERKVQEILANAPVGDFSLLPLDQTPGPVKPDGTKNPMDVELKFFSRVIYRVLNEDVKFAKKNAHRVAVGKPQNLLPYYGPLELTRNDKTVAFDYWSNYHQIEKRDCQYTYELALEAEIQDGPGRRYVAPIIIDPDEGNTGSGHNGFP